MPLKNNMARGPSRFDHQNTMTERQLKSFDVMYNDAENYRIVDIKMRFGMAEPAIIELAKKRGLKLRKGRGQ